MKQELTVQEAGAANEAKPDAKVQLARYVAQQSQARRTFDKVMKGLELAGLALIAGYLAWAIYVSVTWSQQNRIAAIWFGLPICVVILMVLVGLHGAGLRAFFPIYVPSSSFPYVTGSKAVPMGAGFAVLSLVIGAFWGAFAWGMWTTNWTILEPLVQVIGVVVVAGIVIAVGSDLYKRFFRSR